MPTRQLLHAIHREPIARQQGVVLMIALIVLVAMTLAGLALIRSVDTTNIIAGNLGFQQAAMHSGDIGTETAIAWLETNNTGTNLQNDNINNAYFAARAGRDPAANQSWDNYWTTVLNPNPAATPVTNEVASGQVWTLPTDPVTGNTVSYSIQRLCNQAGDPVSPSTGCAVSQTAVTSSGSSKGAGVIALQYASQIYYRITTRITGPRNTVSYIQTIVAL